MIVNTNIVSNRNVKNLKKLIIIKSNLSNYYNNLSKKYFKLYFTLFSKIIVFIFDEFLTLINISQRNKIRAFFDLLHVLKYLIHLLFLSSCISMPPKFNIIGNKSTLRRGLQMINSKLYSGNKYFQKTFYHQSVVDIDKKKRIGFTNSNQIILDRNELKNTHIDTEGKTMIIGFNEREFKKSNKKLAFGDIDTKLNPRFITYFLPAVEIANQQDKPRFVIVSALNIALRYFAQNEEQQKIMAANNAIKMDFLKTFFETFFPDDFSLIEYVVSQDVLKIPEKKLLDIWQIIEKKYPEKIQETKFQLIKFMYPKQFNTKTYSDLSFEKKKKMGEVDAMPAFKYAIAHLFIFGDMNLEGNHIHNPNGYISIGGESELFFNDIRDLSYELLIDFGELLLEKKLDIFNNYRIILKNKYKVPPPHNGMWDENKFLEVTYENNYSICYYDSQEKLKDQMDYMYENLLSKTDYEKFWFDYKSKYFDLKSKYKLAYDIQSNW